MISLNGPADPSQGLDSYLLDGFESSMLADYIADGFGRARLGNVLHQLFSPVSFRSVVGGALGVDYDKFEQDWRTYYQQRSDARARPATGSGGG